MMLNSVKAFGDTAEGARQESVGIIAFRCARDGFAALVTAFARSACKCSARLRDDIDQRRLAAFNGSNRAAKRRSKILWIRDWPFGMQAHSLRHFREIDIGIRECRSRGSAVDATVAFVAHALH